MSIRTVTLNGDAGSIMDANLVDASPFEVAHAQGKMRWHVALVHGRLSTEPSFQSDHLGTPHFSTFVGTFIGACSGQCVK